MENKEKLLEEIKKISSYVYKKYLYDLKKEFTVYKKNDESEKTGRDNFPFCFKVVQLVERLDKKEELLNDKFKNIFAAFSNTGVTIALFAVKEKEFFEFYFFVKSKEIEKSEDDRTLLKNMLLSNFSGSKVIDFEWDCDYKYKPSDKNNDKKLDIKQLLSENKGSVACVSAVATEKSEKFISQGLEKLFDISTEEEYKILILANSLTSDDIFSAKQGYEDLATEIAPFAVRQQSAGKSFSDSSAKTEMSTEAHSHGINKSISNSIGGSIGVNVVVSGGANNTRTETDGSSETDTKSSTFGTTKSTIDAITENSTLTYTEYAVKDSLEKIQEQIKRIDVGKSLGLWKTATYIHSETSATTINIAKMYKGLVQGEKSFIEPCVVTEWHSDTSEPKKNDEYAEIMKYITNFDHPVFVSKKGQNESEKLLVTPAIFVNTSELAYQMCFPQRSIPGLPMLQCAEFAREVVVPYTEKNPENSIKLGCISHMRQFEETTPVELSIQNLASHTFITGSTGSGKSFTIYKLLSELKSKEKKFLVIEPAKGEYKNEFGNNADAVYGTNPKITPSVLRINPFSFFENTHILEHLDRLIEIFNVCWPMYAAMPAVLKAAVEKSYEDCGWNLTESENKYGKDIFPSFSDVVRNIKTIIESSDYDAENKGAYKGSLITRLTSLTNGINGQIFTEDEISEKDLFERNVIVDLSRVGSAETKSLIMGLLVLKLQEYRMNQGASKLKHITVLEEAHNLLKRTSTEQTGEIANLMGKSVEMLTNSIAEMRAFGEGFIIVDQAPGLLDMAVIRNTNTKIILRLPDQTDRELVGKAAGLNDEQIKELAKLSCSVAAIYQNDWIAPVLCKVDEFENVGKFENKNSNEEKKQNLTDSDKIDIVKLLFRGTALPSPLAEDLQKYRLSGRSRAIIAAYQEDSSRVPEFKVVSCVVTELFKEATEALRRTIDLTPDKQTWTNEVNQIIQNLDSLQKDKQLRKDINQAIMTEVLLNELHKGDDFNAWYRGGFLK